MLKTISLGEYKRMLPLKDANQDCVWLTIGIGSDTAAEKSLKTDVYPNCKVFGIEGSPDQVVDFANYGTVINLAVGKKLAYF